MKQRAADSINYNRRHHLLDSILIRPAGNSCKNIALIVTQSDPQVEVKEIRDVPKPEKDPLLTIHGNILYNFNYRSYIDTPFQQSNLMQHTVQSYINGDIEGKYPFKAIFTYRGSNSPYFSNNSDVSIQYRQPDMLEKIKSDLRKDADSLLDKNLLQNPSMKYKMGDTSLLSCKNTNPFTKSLYSKYDSLYAIYKADRDKLAQLEGQADNRNASQALIEAREAKMFPKINPADSLTDSLNKVLPANMWGQGGGKQGESFGNLQNDTTAVINKFTSQADQDSAEQAKIRQQQDSIMKLRKQVAATENSILLLQKHLTDSVALLTRQINQLNNPEMVNDYINKNDTTEKKRLTKAQKVLLSVDQVTVGRSWLNYSELTVKNVSLNGLNIEMSPGKFYTAGAIGSVNNQFRDFVLNNNTSTDQSVGLVRFGIGKKNKTNLIFTLYGGRKAMLNTSGVGDSSATQSIMGASLAGTVAVTKNTSVTAEYARSSYDNIYNPGQTGKSLFGRVVNFGMSTNAAWNFGFQSIYPKTNTKIDGSYMTMGEAFQSFTIYASNVKQDAYLFHVNQLLWKKKLSIDASIKKNDFNSPLTAPGYSNTAIFKSIQASLAIPKYPFVSIGYYPTSQLFVGSGNVVYQSWYNTLNAIASYTYKFAKLNMSTNAVYTKFYNNQSDTSFAYFNAGTFTLDHSVYLTPFIFQGNLTVTDQVGIHLVSFEPIVTYKYKSILSLTGGVTWSRLNGIQTLWGSTAGMSLVIKRIGTIQLKYDKVYLPAYNGTLMPVDMGRITFTKVF